MLANPSIKPVRPPEIIADNYDGVIDLYLTRPPALNSLSLNMVRTLYERLNEWRDDPKIKGIIIRGSGDKAFCAGGDLRALYENRNNHEYGVEFDTLGYSIPLLISYLGKPSAPMMDGMVMGGGAGLGIYGTHRIVTSNAVFAMPECAIGLFPDVGASRFFNHMPKGVGLYLALTGERINGADMIEYGLADYYLPRQNFRGVYQWLIASPMMTGDAKTLDKFIREQCEKPPESGLKQQEGIIEQHFGEAETIHDLWKNLDQSEWGRQTKELLKAKSPTSLAITFRAQQLGKTMTLEEVIAMEYRLAQRCYRGHDFYEGIRAAIIDKDRQPKWQPARLEEVDPAVIEEYFAPLGANEMKLPTRPLPSVGK
ncbi:MAG: enoyl-CoA hydratase/isomerase family protein [Dongiaceae bacterium]